METPGFIVLYFVVAIAVIAFSVMAVTTRRILRAATYLLFVLIGTAIFYFQLGYQFLGGVQIAVYAGGIMVLFVFAILLTSKPADKASLLTHHRRTAGIIASVIGVVVLAWALFHMPLLNEQTTLASISEYPIDMHTLGYAMVGIGKYEYLLPFEAVSVLLLACIIGGVTVARKK